VPASQLTVAAGVVSVQGDPAKTIAYKDLVGGKLFNVTVPTTGTARELVLKGQAKPKDPSQYTLVGKSIPRLDIPPKVTGHYVYVQDVRVPGMLHGRVIQPKGIGSAVLDVGKPPAGVKVVRSGNFLGVVADNEWKAVKAARSLKVKWADWNGLPAMDQLYATLRTSKSEDDVVLNKGDLAALNSGKRFQATYETPFEAHGMIGPSCAVADVRDGRATIWSGSQYPHDVQRSAAKLLGFAPERVRVISHGASGCYGRLSVDDAALDAALMSQLAGAPVRVQWMREDEHIWSPKGAPMLQDLRAAVDDRGNLVAWDHEAWMTTWYDSIYLASNLVNRPVGGFRMGKFNGPLLYDIPNSRQVGHYLQELGADANTANARMGIRTHPLRSPSQYQITFAMESFFDELAAAAASDPIAFRLRYLKDPRAIAVLEQVAKDAKWQTRPSPQNSTTQPLATGRGVAISLRDGTYLAEVAEVEVNRKTGKVHVTRFFAVQDNGLTINPEAVKAQIETAIVQTTSRALYEEMTFDRANVTSADWQSYPIMRITDAPEVITNIIDRPDKPATGAGEAVCNPVAAAIGNAVFDAIGVRLRRLPLRPERVQVAMLAAKA
jgi:nicotinate dehydrogenase subunit B